MFMSMFIVLEGIFQRARFHIFAWEYHVQACLLCYPCLSTKLIIIIIIMSIVLRLVNKIQLLFVPLFAHA